MSEAKLAQSAGSDDIDVYLSDLVKRASPAWDGVTDPNAWLEELRGSSADPNVSLSIPGGEPGYAPCACSRKG